MKPSGGLGHLAQSITGPDDRIADELEATVGDSDGDGRDLGPQGDDLRRLDGFQPLFLTGNTDTVYALALFDLAADGPNVVEVPPRCGPGTVNDAYFRFIIDMGAPGPDRGQGGKYLIVPSDYDGDIPDGYFVGRSPSSVNVLVLRGLLVDGKPDNATRNFREGLKIYPLDETANRPAMEFINGSGKSFNTVHANDFTFYSEIAEVLEREPLDFLDSELRGQAATIGIRKNRPFTPDARMTAILNEAAAVGNATARAVSFQPRDPATFIYDNSAWATGFIGGDYQWLDDGGIGGRNLDARTRFFYLATVNTPAMAMKMVELGSQYAVLDLDSNGDYLDGSKDYRLRIPADAPAKDFWSIVVYDPQTRSELQTTQPYLSKNSRRDPLQTNPDGSIDCTSAPPARKGWFTILRLYGPLARWFDQTWRPGEVEPLA